VLIRCLVYNVPGDGWEKSMRKVSVATRRELIEAVGERYRAANRASKGTVLDEFVAVTGFHRKHAMRILQQEAFGDRGNIAAFLDDLLEGAAFFSW